MTTKTLDLEILDPVGTRSTASPISSPISSQTASPISLTDRSARIRAYHDGCKRSAVGQAIYAVLCGLELNAAKADLAHGKFIKWRESEHPEISKSTVANYMNLATAITAKFPALGSYVATPLQITNGELADPTVQTSLMDALRECSKGTTLTELFREFGIIKQPGRQKYTPPHDQTPEQAARALEQQALDHINSLCADLEFVTPELLARAANKDRARLLDALTDKSKLLRSLVGTRSTASQTKSETPEQKKARRKLAAAARQRWMKAKAKS